MAELKDYNNETFESSANPYGDNWLAQTFTASSSYKITSVKLYLRRFGLPGVVTLSIRETDAEGYPSGEDKTSGTTSGNTLPTWPSDPEWREFSFIVDYEIVEGSKYAIVVAIEGEDDQNTIDWQMNLSDVYAGGSAYYSGDAGVSWTEFSD